MRKSRRFKVKAKPTYAVVVDGETEVWYLQMLKRNERKISVSIEPRIPQKKSVTEQFEMVCKLAIDYTTVFWIVDLDVIIKETREAKRGAITPLQQFINYRKKTEEIENIITIVNNPCIEFWFLLHFEKTKKLYNDCSSAERQLKKHIKNYTKSRKFFTAENNDIYLKLKPNLKEAIKNAKAFDDFDDQNPTRAICEMDLFFETKLLKVLTQ